VREDREELFLHCVQLTQPRGHGIEGAGQHTELVPTADGNRLAERAGRDGGGRFRQAPHRARDPERDDRGGRQRQRQRGGQRNAHPGPRALLQPGHLGLRAHHARVRRLLQSLQMHLHLLGHPPPDRVHHRVPIAPQPRMLLDHRRAIALEGLGGRGQVRLLALRVHQPLQPIEIDPRPVGRLAPELGVAPIGQHHVAGLQARQRQHRVAHARAQTQRGH